MAGPTIGITVTANSQQAQANLNALTTSINNFAQQLANTTPQQLALSKAFEKVQKDFSGGKITLDEARKAMTALAAEAQSLGGKLEQGGKSVGGFSNKFTEMYSQMMLIKQGAMIAAQAIGQAFDLTKEGAQIDLLQGRLVNLAASIGTTSQALMGDLRTATKGLVTDAELTKNAVDIISLGLADTGDGVVDLAKLISALGWDMQTVVLTFANNSKMRLDALGLSVEDVEAKMKALEDQGYDTDKAFDMAVIQAGQEKLKLLGDTADTTVGDLQRLETASINLGNSAKTLAAAFAGPLAEGLVGPTQAYTQLISAMMSGEITYAEAWAWFHKLALTGTDYADVLDFLAGKQDEGTQAAAENSQELQRLMNATTSANQAGEAQITTLFELVQMYAEAGIKTGALADEQDDLEDATKRAAQAMSDLKLYMAGPLGKEYEKFTERNTELQAQIAEVQLEITDLGGTEYMTSAQGEQISTLQAELNNVAAEIVALDDAIKSGELKNNQEYAATQNLEDLREKAWELEQQILGMGGQPYVTSKNLEDIELAKEKLGELNAAIMENATQHRQATKEILFDLASQAAARDGVTTTAEADMLAELANKWGLVDDATYQAQVTFNDAWAQYESGAITAEEALNRIVNYEADLATQASLVNTIVGEKGVGAMTDYREKLMALEEPLYNNTELIGNAADEAAKLNDKLNGLPSTVDITFNLTQNGSVPYVNGAPTGYTTQGQNNEDAEALGASGLDFIVPPGYPNDSYRVGVQSGEHVKVTPAGQTSSGGGSNGNTIVQVFLDGAQIAARVNTYAGQNARRAKNSGVNRP